MKASNYILFFITLSVILLTQGQICNATPTNSNSKFLIKTNVTNVDGTKMGINPGDTLYIESGHRDHLRFYNIHGDSLHYVVFINSGGLVEIDTENSNFGIQTFDCSYFRLTGTGDKDIPYGIKIAKTPAKSNGLALDGLSTDFEVDHLEISKTGFAGICSNVKPDCDNKYNRGSFVQRNTIYHDNYIHNTYGEAFYIGHSFYTGYTIDCNGKDTLIYPHEIKGIQVYNNIIDSCGYDGIQVGCATADCEIYGNRITNYGFINEKNQNFGIIIAAGTSGRCYNNSIINGTGNGINVFGLGNNIIYNNIIINPGYDFSSSVTTSNSCGIFCDDRSTDVGASFNFINNTIISPKGDGIRFFSTESRNSKICNNLILKPGSYGSYYNVNQSYVYYNSKEVDLTISNNYFSNTISPNLDYTNMEDIYRYCSGLPIIDKGMDIKTFDISTDFNGNDRIKNNTCDIGAFEYATPSMQKSSTIKITPEDSNGEITIYSTKKENLENISVFQLSGQIIYNQNIANKSTTTLNLRNMLTKGIYLVCARTETERNMNKIYINY